MKNSVIILLSMMISITGWSDSGDSTPSLKQAKDEAYLFATEQIFSEILDSGSNVYVKLVSSGDARYVFWAMANTGTGRCLAIINVGKELGQAFQEDDQQGMTCIQDKK